MSAQPKDLPQLSRGEWTIMKALWEHGPMATGEIYEKVADETEWAYSTVKTVIYRLVDKGWVNSRRVGNSYLHRPAVKREKAVRRAVREFSSRVLDGLLSPFVAYMAEQEELSEEDLRKLEEIVERHREEKGATS